MATIADIRVKYPQYEDLSDQDLADALYKKHYSDMPREKFNAAVGLSAPKAPEGSRDGDGVFEKIDAGMRGAADMMTLGHSDEIAAGLGTGFGLLGDYDKALARERGIDRFDERENPYARLTGQVAGGVTGGVGMAKGGATLIGRNVPGLSRVAPRATATGLAATEGAGYGGAYGFGSGEGAEERKKLAGYGAATGAVTGAAVQKVGNALATRKAARHAAQAADSVDVLKDATNALYAQSRNAGVTIKQAPLQKLRANMKLAAGRINEKLRPNTAGVVDDIDDALSRNLSLEEFDELRQSVGLALDGAKKQDRRTLMAMKKQIDAFENNITPKDIMGDIRGFDFIKQGRALNARKEKTRIIEKIIDSADVRSGQYSQSGAANAVRTEMRQLYKRIKDGKAPGFTTEETALIRQMATGKTSNIIMRTFAKFAPRGVISIVSGQVVGSAAPGVGNVAVPLIGHAAGGSVDKAAVNALSGLRNAAASGLPPALPQISTGTAPFIPGAAEGATSVRQRLMNR
ncbi:MAG: hypothetical protein GY807_20510 [Gammaproteobacteria bacterium]|nr:hypothetical protein [Gammaproteobacteria bacterium]